MTRRNTSRHTAEAINEQFIWTVILKAKRYSLHLCSIFPDEVKGKALKVKMYQPALHNDAGVA